MKIQCDACEKAPATVICCADEAALCASCDIEIHAANKLASKHQRLLLQCLSNKLPRCDICQEKAAFIFCVEDRALFCRECDEPIHVAGTLSGDHQRYLATGIRVAPSSVCKKDTKKGQSEASNNSPIHLAPKVPATQAASSAFAPSAAWAVDEFLQLSDYESGDKGVPPIGFGELEWFADIGVFNDQMPKGTLTAAEVPELPTSQASNAAFYRSNKDSNISHKKPRIELSDDEEYFTVPDLG
ncbi:B-box zinc finger protein 24-like [Phoenix dactylifera]|uniref:B-box zinc finger protein 24-like n=1 Tax=Phoenix dactylifera TaxID=42345 RepID=A0A8B7CIV8_PHODC|nr:B-box zinc finger protein 24-like [Phoenix dactylifera]